MSYLRLPFLFLGSLTMLSSGLTQQPVSAQNRQSIPHIRFEHLTVADGLPENTVICILQDHLGFIWMGTQNGLVRYDGTTMTTFQYDPRNPYSLKAQAMRSLYEDRNGDIWIGAENLFRYERATGRFIEYNQKNPEKKPDKGRDEVLSIQEDRRGDLWMVIARQATQTVTLDRLNPRTRSWNHYRHNPKDPHSLGSNSVVNTFILGAPEIGLCEDKTGTLWVITYTQKGNELYRFDASANGFARITFPTNPAIDLSRITGILPDKQGNLYLSSQSGGKGLVRWNPKTRQLNSFTHDPANPNSLQSNQMLRVHQSRDGLIWAPTDKGLDRLNPETGQATHFVSKSTDPNTPSPGQLRFLAETPTGNLWFVAADGLNVYDRQQNRFVRYKNTPDQEDALQIGQAFRSLLIDRTGLVWVGSWLAGVNKQSRQAKFAQLALSPSKTGLSSPAVEAIYEAPSEPGIIWFGTREGLTRLDKKTGLTTYFHHDSLNPQSIGKGRVNALVEDRQGRFWVATSAGGLNLMDRKRGTFSRFVHDPARPESLASNVVIRLLPASDGTLWVGTDVGLDQFNIARRTFTHHYTADSTYTPACYARLGQLATPKRRLAALLHPGNNANQTTEFTLSQSTQLVVVAEGEFDTNNRYDFGWIEDQQGKRVWDISYANSVGDGVSGGPRTRAGVIRLKAGRYRLRYHSDKDYAYGHWAFPPPYHPELWGIQLLGVTPDEAQQLTALLRPRQTTGLSDRIILSLWEDAQKRVWIGFNSGSFQIFTPSTGTYQTRYNYFTGPRAVNIILPDKDPDRVWIGDYLFGLFLMDREGKILKRYSTANGLPNNSVESIRQDAKGYLWLTTYNGLARFDPKTEQFRHFNRSNGLSDLVLRASWLTQDGELYVGGPKGVNSFYPAQIQDDPVGPPVILTDLLINGQPATLGENGQLPAHVSVVQAITLPYDQNNLTFQFTALNYSRGNESQYAYQLSPIDKDWVQNGTIRQARYSDLSPGIYTFRVKAANAEGGWNERGTSIQVTIGPPWWRTWWAYLLYGLMFVALLRTYIVYRSRVLRRENRLLEEKVVLRTNQVQQQKEEIEAQRDYLESTLSDLKSTQTQLIQKEKLASLGELTAGIAHEIQNPLNFVNNFSEVSAELVSELREEEIKTDRDIELIQDLLNDLSSNLQKINHHGGRASSIVKSMLEHSRTESGERRPTDLNALADEYLKIAYHGLRAKDKAFNCELVTDFEPNLGLIEVAPQEIGRVLLNLYNNAFYAVSQQAKQSNDPNYKPTVEIHTQQQRNQLVIQVKDNGIGMPDSVKAKIFQPFFTTKPTGEGTGLGLSLSYDIITKGHGGTLRVESQASEGSSFVIALPK